MDWAAANLPIASSDTAAMNCLVCMCGFFVSLFAFLMVSNLVANPRPSANGDAPIARSRQEEQSVAVAFLSVILLISSIGAAWLLRLWARGFRNSEGAIPMTRIDRPQRSNHSASSGDVKHASDTYFSDTPEGQTLSNSVNGRSTSNVPSESDELVQSRLCCIDMHLFRVI